MLPAVLPCVACCMVAHMMHPVPDRKMPTIRFTINDETYIDRTEWMFSMNQRGTLTESSARVISDEQLTGILKKAERDRSGMLIIHIVIQKQSETTVDTMSMTMKRLRKLAEGATGIVVNYRCNEGVMK